MKQRRLTVLVLVLCLVVATILAACGSTEYTVTFRDGTTDVSTVKVADGEALTAEQIPQAPTGHNGMDFGGWYVGDTKVEAGYKPDSDVVATAKWTQKATKHTVTFRDGTTDIATVEVADGEALTAEQIPQAPSGHDGFSFDGWFVGTVKVEAGYKPDSDVVATARFSDNTPRYAKLTLNAGNGGSIDVTSYDVQVGTSLLQFLSDKLPTPQEKLSFNGWYNGRSKIGERDTMPNTDLTLTAKYDAAYKVKRYFADVNDDYSEEFETATGKAIFGEPFTYTESAPVHYVLDDNAEGFVATTDSLGKEDVFCVYYLRATVTVHYDVNIDGVDASIPSDGNHVWGEKVPLADGNNFDVPSNYRFAGWSTRPDGEVEFASGDLFDTDDVPGNLTTLYACWSKALIDAMGGDDYLFLSLTEEGVVYLHREGLQEKVGAYDNAGKFSFSDGDKVVLEGRISGEYFYYFENFDGQVMKNGADPKETLTFSNGENVTYTVEGETPIQGTYALEVFTGEYVFVSDSKSFHFTVNTVTSPDGTRVYVFNRPVSGEAGFYMFGDGKSVLYLDGMVDSNGIGGLRLFSVNNGKLQAAMQAFYYEWEDNVILDDGDEHNFYLFEEKTYVVITSQQNVLFLFRVNDDKVQSVDGVEMRGTYLVSDGFEGHYFGDAMNDEPDLLIDGFGKALVKRDGESDYIEGTYTIGSRILKMKENNVIGNWEDNWLEVTADGVTTIERLAYSFLPQHGAVEYAPRLIRWAQNNPVGKVYGGAPDYLDTYIYDSTVNGAYILGRAIDERAGEYYEALDRGTITKNSDGTYRFVSSLYTTENNFWDFRYNKDGTIETSLAGAAAFSVTGQDVSFSVDMWGYPTYNGKQYTFADWSVSYMYANTYKNKNFYLEFYVLDTDNGEVTISVRVDIESDGQTTTYNRSLLAANAVVDIIYQQYYGQEDYYDKLYIIDEDHAAIGFLSQDGNYYFMMFGDLSYDTNAKEYRFIADKEEHDKFVEQIGDEDLVDLYADFFFEYNNGDSTALMRTYKTKFQVEGGPSFNIDGYGNATLVTKDGDVQHGTYSSIDAFGKYLFEFVNNGTHYISIVYDGDIVKDILVDAEGAGIYYYLWSTGDIYLDTYAVFLGDYVAAHDQVEEHEGTVVYLNMYGTYKPTGKKIEYGYGSIFSLDEYCLSLRRADNTEFQTYVAMGAVQFTLATGMPAEFNCFVERMEPQADRHFDVVGGGTITGDGYNDSVYEDAEGRRFLGLIGIGVIKDSSPNMSDYDWDDDFEHGKQLVFRASYEVIDGNVYRSSGEFLFDIGDDGKLTLRDNYNATFALYEQGNITKKTLYLDGHGNATLRDETEQVVDTGKYSFSEELQCLLYDSNNGDGKDFRFQVLQMSLAEEEWFIYSVIEDELVYVNDDWSVLLMGGIRNDPNYGYINGLYVTARGSVHAGFFSKLAEDVVRFAGNDGTYIYFDVQAQEKSFAINTDLFIIRDKVLLAYQGPSVITDLKIPDGVTSIGANAFASVYRMGGVAYTLDFNQVERIEDYAFYGVHEFAYPSIASDKVVYVGNYSFYSPYTYYASATEDLPFSWLRDVNFPKATYIGDYAFNGCNQMNNGKVKLSSVTYIGYSAFSHNTFENVKMVLDLTDANIENISIDRNAFLPGPNTDLPQLGLPVIIWVRSEEAKQQTSGWHEDIQKCVIVKEISMVGVGYFDFDTRDYLLFGNVTDKVGAITLYKYAESGYTKQENVGSYTFTDYRVIELTFNGKKYTLDCEDPVVETETNTFLRDNTMHTFMVKNDKQEEKELRIEFTVSVDEMMGIDLSMNIETAIFDKNVANNAIVDMQGFVCNMTYSRDETIYNLTINMTDWTYNEVADGIVVLSDDGLYRVNIERWVGGHYMYLSLEELKDGEYVQVFSNKRYDSPNNWTYVNETENSATIYTVTYDPALNAITVNVTTLKKVVLTTKDNKFKATLALNDKDVIEELYRFEVYSSYGYFETVYNYKDLNFNIELEMGNNTFTITRPLNGTVAVYTATYADGQLTVTEKSLSVLKVNSVHQDKENYYTVSLLIDNGEVVGLTGELVAHTYNERTGFYDDFSISVFGEVTRDGDTFTFTNGDTYVITCVKGADGNYTVSVQKS